MALNFLLDIKKAAFPSSICDAMLVSLGAILKLIKRIQLTALRKQGCAYSMSSCVPYCPVPSGRKT